jgi:hypothetical protein
MFDFIGDLLRMLPNATYYKRQGLELKKMCKWGAKHEFTHCMVINENRKEVNGLVLIYLPYGPTAHFRISNLVLSKVRPPPAVQCGHTCCSTLSLSPRSRSHTERRRIGAGNPRARQAHATPAGADPQQLHHTHRVRRASSRTLATATWCFSIATDGCAQLRQRLHPLHLPPICRTVQRPHSVSSLCLRLRGAYAP